MSIRGSYVDGTLAVPSLHYQTDVPPGGDEPDPDDVATGVWGVIGTTYLAACRAFTVHQVVATEQVLPPDIPAQGLKSVEAGGTLAGSDSNLPYGLVPIVNLRTDVASRSSRGHIVLPGPVDSTSFTAGLWNTAHQTAYNALAAKLDDSFDLGTLFITHVNPVVYSRKRHKDGLTPYTFRVSSASLNTTPHWLRSRMTKP